MHQSLDQHTAGNMREQHRNQDPAPHAVQIGRTLSTGCAQASNGQVIRDSRGQSVGHRTWLRQAP
jgi:hypothetical protein